jgi:hypothetical protein
MNNQAQEKILKSNNPFTRHGIEHLSPSKINLWISDPALFIGTYLCGMKGSYGVGAFRGNAVEFALSKKITTKDLSQEAADEFLYSNFNEQCIENNISMEDIKAQKERSSLGSYYQQALNVYDRFGQPEHYQHKVYYSIHEDIPTPFLGYIDFVFKDAIRDLKTTGIRPSKFSQAHQRQLAVYSKAFPDKELWCDYVTKKEAMSFKLQNVEETLNQVIKISLGLQKFLSISDDPYELASMHYPNYDSWMWSEEMKNQSTKIWSNK